MRKIISIVLLAAFALQLTGNYWILAAFYFNRDYIASNICVNRFDRIPVCKGACYLEKKLTENAARQEKSPDLKPVETALYHPAAVAVIAPAFVKVISTHYFLFDTHLRVHRLPSTVFRPPCLPV